jgi:tetraacyldisaccharide 4'-kinase
MQVPAFWARPPETPGMAARMLAPLAWIWTAVTRRRLARAPRFAPGVPVICVGNLTAGGAGKTPTVIALIERLRARGLEAQVITRGHGGRLAGPVRVDAARHVAADVGDEPLLLAAFAPVWVGRDRAAAARAAVAGGAGVLVMDDGLQNPDLAKDLSLVVVDAGFGFGNGRVIPAGPLREPLLDGLARTDLVLAIGPAPERERLAEAWPVLAGFAELAGALVPLPTGMDWQGLRALAFAGIGRPEKFFATLRGLGAEVVAVRAFADHAAFDSRVLARLEAEAAAARAQLVTTEKDAVRLPPEFRRKLLVLPVRLEIEDWAPLDAAFARLKLAGVAASEGRGASATDDGFD